MSAENLVALTDVSFDVGHGEFVVILGPSGAGKSTMLRCINRLAEPTSGRIFLRGKEITSAPRSLRTARREIGMVFQQFNLVTRLSVMMNVLSGRLSYRSTWRSLFYSFTREDRAIALECLEMVALGKKALPARRHTERRRTAARRDRARAGAAAETHPRRRTGRQPRSQDRPPGARLPEGRFATARDQRDLQPPSGRLCPRICRTHHRLSQGRLIFDGPPSALTDDILNQIYGPRTENAVG